MNRPFHQVRSTRVVRNGSRRPSSARRRRCPAPGHARRRIDHVEHRLLKGEKVFSIFETHMRWIPKGKAGTPVEFGVPGCVLEDNPGLHSVPQGHVARQRPCPTDDPGDPGAIPRPSLVQLRDQASSRRASGSRCAAANTAGRSSPAHRQHAAVELAIDILEHRGLYWVRAFGAGGFARLVAHSIAAFNIHRIGLTATLQTRGM